MANMEVSTVFRKLNQYPPVICEDDQSILEKFVVTMNDMSSATDSIDVCLKNRGHMTQSPNTSSP